MKADCIPLIIGIPVFASSLISMTVHLSTAVTKIILGAIAGNLGLKPEEWMFYLADFGGIRLTFMTGTKMDTRLLKERFKTR